MCCVFCHGLEESPLRWGSQNWKTNVASSYRTATVRRRRSWRPALVGLGGWGTVPVLGSTACLESWPSSDSMRAGVPGLARSGRRMVPTTLLAHGPGGTHGGRGIKPRNLPAAVLHRQLPVLLTFAFHLAIFSFSPPPRCVRGPLNSPSRSGCLARDIPGTHFSASPALFPVPGPHLSDRPFFRFSSHPLPLS